VASRGCELRNLILSAKIKILRKKNVNSPYISQSLEAVVMRCSNSIFGTESFSTSYFSNNKWQFAFSN
jgi:hypothetical protein